MTQLLDVPEKDFKSYLKYFKRSEGKSKHHKKLQDIRTYLEKLEEFSRFKKKKISKKKKQLWE
jgi:hypothetical protein